MEKTMLNTENFSVKKYDNNSYKVLMNGNEVKFVEENRAIHPKQSDAYDITLEELSFLPFNIGIDTDRFDKYSKESDLPRGYSVCINEIRKDEADIYFWVFGDYEHCYEPPVEDQVDLEYLDTAFRVINGSEKFQITEQIVRREKLDNEELRKLIDDESEDEISGPFQFCITVGLETFGELVLSIDTIIQQLDNTVLEEIGRK